MKYIHLSSLIISLIFIGCVLEIEAKQQQLENFKNINISPPQAQQPPLQSSSLSSRYDSIYLDSLKTSTYQPTSNLIQNYGFEYKDDVSWTDIDRIINHEIASYNAVPFNGESMASFIYSPMLSYKLATISLNQKFIVDSNNSRSSSTPPTTPTTTIFQFAINQITQCIDSIPQYNFTISLSNNDNNQTYQIYQLEQQNTTCINTTFNQDGKYDFEFYEIDVSNYISPITTPNTTTNYTITLQLNMNIQQPSIPQPNLKVVINIDDVCIFFKPLNEINTPIYVSSLNGNDSNDGVSINTPFASIQYAIDSSVDGNTIYVDSSAPYLFDILSSIYTRGKSISLIGNNSVLITISLNLFIIHPKPTKLSTTTLITTGSIIKGFQFNNILDTSTCYFITLAMNTSVLFDGCNFTVTINGPICANRQSNLTISNSNIQGNSRPQVIQSIWSSVIIWNSTITNSYPLIYSNWYSPNVYEIHGSKFRNSSAIVAVTVQSAWIENITVDNDDGFLSIGGLADTMLIDGLYSNSSTARMVYCYGGTKVVVNNIVLQGYYGSNLVFHSMQELVISNVMMRDGMGKNEMFSIQNVEQVTITNATHFNNLVKGLFHLWSFNQVGKLTMSQIISDRNEAPFLRLSQVKQTTINYMSVLANSLYTLVTCSDTNITISNSLFIGNSAQAISAQNSTLVLQRCIFSSNVNTIYNQYPMITTTSSQLTIQDGQFSNNTGVDIVTVLSSLAVIRNTTFTNNHFCTHVTVKQGLLDASDLLITGASEQQPVFSLSRTTALLCTINITSCVSPFVIDSSTIDFNGIILASVVGSSDAAITLRLVNGSWSNSSISNMYISLMNSSIWMVDSHIKFTNFTMQKISNAYSPMGHYDNSHVEFLNSSFIGNVGSVRGGMRVIGNSQLIIKNSKFEKNFGREVSLLKVQNSHVRITDSTFKNSVASIDGAISVDNCTFSIFNCDFIETSQGPTLRFVGSSGDIDLVQIKFSSSDDALMMIESTVANLSRLSFISAFSLNDGSYSAIHIRDHSGIKITESMLRDSLGINKPTIMVEQSDIEVESTIFSQNSNLYGLGGDLYLSESNCSIVNCTFTEGGSHLGGCIYASDSLLSAVSTTFSGCQGTAGGGLFLIRTNTTILNSTFVNLVAQSGVYTNLSDSRYFLVNGGAILVYSGSDLGNHTDTQTMIIIDYSRFTYNSAGDEGGALWVYPDSPTHSTNVTISRSSFQFNRANGGGGAIFGGSPASVKLIDTWIFNNSADYGQDFASSGVAIDISFPSPVQHVNEFTIVLSYIDAYGQVITNHPDYVFVMDILGPNITPIAKTSITYLGQSRFFMSIAGQVGDVYTVNAGLFDGSGNPIRTNSTQVTVQPCVTSTQYLLDGVCTNCPLGSIGHDGLTCFTCPFESTSCQTGVILANQGYWLDNSSKTFPPEIYKCDPSVCLANGQCRDLHTGPLCGWCVEGAAKSLVLCNKCGEGTLNIVLVLGYVGFAALITIILSRVNVPSRTVIFGMLFSLQLIAIVGERNDSFYLLSLVNFRIDYWPQSCVSSNLTNYLVKYLISLAVIIVVTSLALVLPMINWSRKLLRITYQPAQTTLRLVSILLVLYTPLTYLSATILPCTNIENTMYLVADQQIECFTPLHIGTAVLAAIIIFVLTFGLPILMYKRGLFLRPLFVHYKRVHRYWEWLRQSMSFIFTWASALLPFYEPEQSLILVAVCILKVGLVINLLPYFNKNRNVIEMIFAIFVLCACIMPNSRSFSSSFHLSYDLGYIQMVFCIFTIIVTIIYLIKKHLFKRKLIVKYRIF